MSTLHTLSKAPSFGLLNTCLSIIQTGDAVLLIEDGVYHCQQPAQLLKKAGVKFYCLREDLIARGLIDRKLGAIETVSTQGFVDLCVSHDGIVNWF
jgi:tRNA 2-thiouridine synthesizing protein B